MIEALVLVHLWSLAVAGGAWCIQRDGKKPIGSRFPAPAVWLVLILTCLLPGALFLVPFGEYMPLPEIQAFEVQAMQTANGMDQRTWLPNLLMLYFGLASVLAAQTLWRWLQLQRLPLKPTAISGVFSTPTKLPPLTLSWPARAIVIPEGIEAKASLIQHERAHLQHNDGELTLLLLILQDLMMRNPGIGYLVRQWRLAIELRADQAATEMLSLSDRKEYAELLLESHRPDSGDQSVLPCPTAQLGNSCHRNVKMRLIQIIGKRAGVPKADWRAAVICALVGASFIGFVSNAVAEEGTFVDLGSNKVSYAAQTPPLLPAKCPGYKLEDVASEKAYIVANGRLVPGYKVRLGTVILKHDVRSNGGIYNPRVLDSTHGCFEAEAKAALLQWKTDAQAYSRKNAVVKMHFTFSAETADQLNARVEKFCR